MVMFTIIIIIIIYIIILIDIISIIIIIIIIITRPDGSRGEVSALPLIFLSYLEGLDGGT